MVKFIINYSIIIVILTISTGPTFKFVSSLETSLKVNNYLSFPEIISYEQIRTKNDSFDISSKDIITLLHIQKTGGTSFERHLVQDLQVERPCSCNQDGRRCSCPRRAKDDEKPRLIVDSTWLISRFSTGWICGLHPDWGQLTKCLTGLKRVFILSFLRHPLDRFVSEFRHVQRGATWKASRSLCKEYDTQLCYRNQSSWADVQLEEFINCPNNMAINRQTRMLANIDRSMCGLSGKLYDSLQDEVGDLMLKSAIENLNKLAFFGLCERQRDSQLLFENTFKMKFKEDFQQSEDNKTRVLISELPNDIQKRIISINNLDMELYNYASNMFFHRLNELKSTR